MPPLIDLGNIFTYPESSSHDHDLFADELVSFAQDYVQENTNDFSFDQMVNLEACQAQPSDVNNLSYPELLINDDDMVQIGPHIIDEIPGSAGIKADFEHQLAAKSSGMQPCLGASS